MCNSDGPTCPESTSPKLAELHYRKSFYSPDVDRSRWDALMWKDYNDFRPGPRTTSGGGVRIPIWQEKAGVLPSLG